MLVFVVPLKSRRVAKSWDYVSLLFERCLRSICAQTSSDFRVVVVHHEKPEIGFDHPAVIYAAVEFPVPGAADHPALNLDKFRKRARGFALAREFGPTHMMQVDGDDCVSNRLAAWVNENSAAPGWYFDTGYFYRDGTRRIFYKPRGFHTWCGTSHIFRSDLLKLPSGTEFDDSHVRALRPSLLRPLVAPLPFPGAVYVNTKAFEGNHSRRNLWEDYTTEPKLALYRAKKRFDEFFNSAPIAPPLAAEFGLYPLDAAGGAGITGSSGAAR